MVFHISHNQYVYDMFLLHDTFFGDPGSKARAASIRVHRNRNQSWARSAQRFDHPWLVILKQTHISFEKLLK
jgi:hypothetical protein